MDYGGLPPEINSGRMYAGPGTGPMVAAASAWQALAVQMGSAGAAFQAVIQALTAGPWMGPSSWTMAASAAPYVVWMIATAAQCQEASAAALQAAGTFEAARAGVIPPAEIAENRARLAALIGGLPWTAPAVAATEAQYDYYWAHDATTLYGYAADSAGTVGSLVPFLPAASDSNPAGLAAQAGAVSQAAGQGVGTQASRVSETMANLGGMPGGFDSVLSMAPQLFSAAPQALQSLASPLTSGGQLQSLFSPFMSMFSNPGMFGSQGAAGLGSVAGVAAMPGMSGGLSGLGGASAAAPIEAVAGRTASLGGLSVPATWTAGAGQTASVTTVATPMTGSGASAAVPASASGGGMYGGAPMAAGMGGRSGSDGQPRYGNPIRITPPR